MPVWLIALLFSLGASTWIYTRFMRSTGSNEQASLGIAAVLFVVLFGVVWSVLGLFM